MIQIQEQAKDKLLSLMSEGGYEDGAFVRVSVKGGGCSGLMYDLGFDTQLKEDDKEFEDKGVKIVVDKKSMLYLVGTNLEYEGGLNGKGFSFRNPNASRTCGCGESFAVWYFPNMKEENENDILKEVTSAEYKYGFVTDVDADQAPKGLNEEIIRFISAKKNEPEWLLEWRLKAFEQWKKMTEPSWAHIK